jgi:hypothetical protein
MTSNCMVFTQMEPFLQSIITANCSTLEVTGRGTVELWNWRSPARTERRSRSPCATFSTPASLLTSYYP